MATPTGQNSLPNQTPNTSAPIGSVNEEVRGLMDSQGKPITGTLTLNVLVTAAWRYLFGTFVQRSSSVDPTFSLTAGATYDQAQLQAIIDQVAALSRAVGK